MTDTVGVVIGVCSVHEHTTEALEQARRHTAGDVIVILNGVPPSLVDIPDGVEVELHDAPIDQEQGVWRRAFAIATERGWDWCAICHDDFAIDESGWEEILTAAGQRWRIGVAGWETCDFADVTGYSAWDAQVQAIRPGPPVGRLRILSDGCGIVFNMALFSQRGCFTTLQDRCGYGDHETCYYSLSQSHCTFHIGAAYRHRWLIDHARSRLGLTDGGNRHTLAGSWASVLPAEVLDDNTVMICGVAVDMRRTPSE